MGLARSRGVAVGIVAIPDCRRPRERTLIFITAKFQVRPEHADAWPELAREFTEATRSEPGCLWFQ